MTPHGRPLDSRASESTGNRERVARTAIGFWISVGIGSGSGGGRRDLGVLGDFLPNLPKKDGRSFYCDSVGHVGLYYWFDDVKAGLVFVYGRGLDNGVTWPASGCLCEFGPDRAGLILFAPYYTVL